ncbi:NAD(P)/FAD-dependent oxidoreductase [Methylovulum psychrotolerans]|uniref:FAD-binding oxidoreductase n=1 Tax=Methylovulum psychrotolerans TaxID=1704499 RepID=A0A2S5CPV4_9GAMM|nr:FAD-binding oxidoreductase [Methylovulum psychrotolerans]POZ52841.1 FAD-binding oxidoreductase [Methylovulum psychrotolerans]
MPVDFLIIGQGLAGSLLAWELIQRGSSVLVVDNGQENASQIAAGLINPVTGLRLVKSTEADTLLPVAKHCYQQLASVFGQPFYIEKPMLRLLHSPAQYQQAEKRLRDDAYQAYLATLYPPNTSAYGLSNPDGAVVQQQTGYLLTRPLLACLRGFLLAQNSYRQAAFHPDDLRLNPLRWQDIKPKRLIFCEGYHAQHNPWFSWLPFQPAKGEILTLAHHQPLPDALLNYGHWLLPLNSQHSRIGATFTHNATDTEPTAQGRQQLLAGLAALSADLVQAELTAHHANIRPCTLDKQPFLGYHPQHPQLAIFNGFGAKGSLQIPWYSQRFADSLLNNTPAPGAISRHYAAHYPA